MLLFFQYSETDWRETMAGKAPGKHHRKGITLIEVTRMFPDDEAAEAWFVNIRWPDGVVTCPSCESDNVKVGAKHPTMSYRCRPCRKYFSVKTGTAMESSKLGLQVWAMAMYLLSTGLKGTSSMKLHRDLGVTQKTAWHLAHRIRESWDETADPFAGPVEVDETFVGGLEKNRHAHKKLHAGRGAAGKTVVAGAKDRETGQVSASVVQDTSRATLQPFVVERTEPGAQVYTDEHGAYRGLPGVKHQTVKHSTGEWVDGQAHTNGVESFWSMLKRGYHGTYHQLSSKHLQRYVTEFAGRHNVRDLDTVHQMAAVARGMVGKRLRYRDLVA